MALPALSTELVASGVVGILLAGAVIKKAFDGYVEARRHMIAQQTNPMTMAMAAVWGENERERFLQLLERITIALEDQAKHQGILADQRQQDMNEKIDRLVQQMENMPTPAVARRRRRTKK